MICETGTFDVLKYPKDREGDGLRCVKPAHLMYWNAGDAIDPSFFDKRETGTFDVLKLINLLSYLYIYISETGTFDVLKFPLDTFIWCLGVGETGTFDVLK